MGKDPNERTRLKMALNSIKKFQDLGTLQLCSLKYIASKNLTQSETDDLKDTFFALNVSCTGLLTRQELMNAFWANGYEEMSYFELDNILAKIDLDNSGKINFSEFLLPAVSAIEMVSNN